MAASHTMLSMYAVALLLSSVVGEPMLAEADDEIAAAFLSAQKAVAAVPAQRRLGAKDATSCAMDVSAGTADLLQVGMGIWSSVKLCKTVESESRDKKIACTADLVGVVTSLTNVGQYIIGALESCAGQVKMSDTCSRNSLIMAGSISAAAGSSASLSAGCGSVKQFQMGTRNQVINGASCIIDVRSAVTGLLKIIMSLVSVQQQCAVSPEQCASSTSHVVASLANLGKFVLSAAGDCAGKVPPGSACGEDIASLVAALSTIASTSTDVETACNPNAPTPAPPSVSVVVQPDGTVGMPGGAMTKEQTAEIAKIRSNINNFQRLYGKHPSEDVDLNDARELPFPPSMILAGLIPFTVIIGFLAGKRHHQVQAPTKSRDVPVFAECPQD